MKINRMLSILCAVTILICAVSVRVYADYEATPTDLAPAKEENTAEETKEEATTAPKEEKPAQETAAETTESEDGPVDSIESEDGPVDSIESEDEPVDSIEVIVTKTLRINQSWDGKMKKTKPAVLKLDISKAGTVYMLVEGRDVWATVEKSDRITENPASTETDPETEQMIISWEAEEGSYLITLGPVEPNLMAMATVTFMDAKTYEAWEAEQAQKKTEEKESEFDTDEEQIEENEPASENMPDRHITIDITTDSPNPVVGDTAHFKATLYGYEKLNYTIQWQYSLDRENWIDIPNETDLNMDVVVTMENNVYYWRIMIYVEEITED